MALFNPSTIPWVTAVGLIADSAGASSDTEMTTRAHHSLRASFQWLQGKDRWDFLRVEATPLRVFAPFQVAVTASGTFASASALTGHGVLVDDFLVGSGFMVGTRVTATGASGFGFSPAITGFSAATAAFTITATRDYYDAPSDWKQGYTLRLLSGTNRRLPYIGRRLWDAAVVDEHSAGTVEGYDMFSIGGKGKVRLVPPPASSDVLLQRYYRRFTLASASGSTVALDLPEDYESYLLAYGKWHFLTDKQQERTNQATTWLSLAQDGLKTMIMEQQNIPDEALGFIPGAASPMPLGDRSTRGISWET